MSLHALTRFTLQGPGSVPVRCGTATARGMFDVAVTPTRATATQEVERDVIALHLFRDVLPEAIEDAVIQVGEPDLAAANVVADDDPQYRVATRRPVGDGLVHVLELEGGP